VALNAATAALSAEERNLLRFAIVDKLDADAIANVYGIHRTTAGRRLALARDALAARTREALKRQLRVSDKELESIVRLVHSQLDVTFERLLRDIPQ
jgi:RNA polymerase sigma-70 factor, ECF subfamily